MDPRKIGIKCARHFMTGAEHLLSIFYSGFHCKKAPSPKLHSFPFPWGGGGGGIGGRIRRPVGEAAAIAFRPKVRPCLGLLGLPPGTDPWIHRSIQIPRNASQMNLQIHPHGKAAQMNKWNKVLSETPHHCGGAKWHDRLSKAPLTKRHKGNLCPWHKYKDFSDFPVLQNFFLGIIEWKEEVSPQPSKSMLPVVGCWLASYYQPPLT